MVVAGRIAIKAGGMRMVRYVILGLLRDGCARHGYAIMKDYREGTGNVTSVGNIYRELHSLRDLGWVREGTNPEGSDARRLPYAITAAGASALHEWLAAPAGPVLRSYGDTVSLRAFVVAHIGYDLPTGIID